MLTYLALASRFHLQHGNQNTVVQYTLQCRFPFKRCFLPEKIHSSTNQLESCHDSEGHFPPSSRIAWKSTEIRSKCMAQHMVVYIIISGLQSQLELIPPHDFRQKGKKNLEEEMRRHLLQSFLKTSFSPSPPSFLPLLDPGGCMVQA